jgi:hypothetical protein
MPGTPKGIRYGGRKPHTPNKVTQSICILLNTILPPEELEKHWRFCLKHKDIEIRFAAFKLAQLYMFGRPSPLPLAQEDAPQQQREPEFDLSAIPTRHVPIRPN